MKWCGECVNVHMFTYMFTYTFTYMFETIQQMLYMFLYIYLYLLRVRAYGCLSDESALLLHMFKYIKIAPRDRISH
jgi:hypothetical protein